jgi:hypothetical protein
MKKNCTCRKFKKFAGVIDSGLVFMHSHGMYASATKGIGFNFCPWCGKSLTVIKECPKNIAKAATK